jgi:anaerobic magnesium-protoporphyrin IX monomethyl ester cyclase
MRILFINPPNKPFSERSLLIEPIDLLTAASYMQSLGHDVKAIDMDVKQMPPESIGKILSTFSPELTVIPFDYHIPLHKSESVPGIGEIAKACKESGSIVVTGGKTPKHYPKTFLDSSIDAVINSDLEPVLEQLAELRLQNPKAISEKLSAIPGITYQEDGRLISTPHSQAFDLNLLPIPDRNLLDLSDYIDVRSIWSSRGCTGGCAFCATPSYWGNWRGIRSSKVVDEIEQLVDEHDAQKILFIDDNATVSLNRMKEISSEIIRRGIDAKFGCLSRASSYDPETMGLMAEAGFRWIHYGGESGSQRVLDQQNKRITVSQIREAIVGTKKQGMRVRTSWIADLPGTDHQALDDTAELILATTPQEVRIHYLVPRVGTIYNPASGDASKNQPIASQYIHSNRSRLELATLDSESIAVHIDQLAAGLQAVGYLKIDRILDWGDVKKLEKESPDLKFISFCPSRYGLGWEGRK